MTRSLVGIALVVALVFGGCSARSTRSQLVPVSGTIYQTLTALQQGEITLNSAGKVPAAFHKLFHEKMVLALTAGQQFNTVVTQLPVGTPAPTELAVLASAIGDLAADVIAALPEGEAKGVLQKYLGAVQTSIAVYMQVVLGGR